MNFGRSSNSQQAGTEPSTITVMQCDFPTELQVSKVANGHSAVADADAVDAAETADGDLNGAPGRRIRAKTMQGGT